MNHLLDKISNLVKRGMFHILGSTLINKMIAFITNIALVRILSKTNYGIFTGAYNIFLVAELFSGFGVVNAVLYFCSDKQPEQKRNSYYKFAAIYGAVTDAFLFFALILYSCIGNMGIEEIRPYVAMMALLPMAAFFYSYFSVILRSRKENKRYARLLNINTISYAVFAIIGSYFWGIPGTIAGRYLAYILSGFIGLLYSKSYISWNAAEKLFLEKSEKREMVKYACSCGMVSALNNILYKIDVALIAKFVADAEVLASYKVATVIPENLNFIPQCVMIFALPLFVDNKDNSEWIYKYARIIYLSMSVVSAAISAVMFITAPTIIELFWGSQYIDATLCFRILSLSFFLLATFRITSTNILAALGKVNFNLIVSIISGCANIALDFVMIQSYGSIGAAIATLIISFLASILSFPYLLKQIRNIKMQSTTKDKYNKEKT